MYLIYAAIVYAIYLFISSYFSKVKEINETNQRYYKLSEQNKINESYLAKYNSMFSHLDSKIIRRIQTEEIYKYSLLPTKVSSRQLDKYISKINDNRRKRNELASKKPIISAAIENGALDDRSWIERYKEECMLVQKEKSLVAPSIPIEGLECKIVKNIDGDTVWVSIPSLNIDKIKVRVVGYDTPESHRPGHGIYHGAYEACVISDELISKASTAWIRYDRKQVEQKWLFDKYGRLLAHIYLDNKPLGLSLIEEGYAFYMNSFPMEDSFHVEYSAAEGMARAEDKGMWESLNKLSERELKKVKFGLNEFISQYSDLINEETRIRDALNYMLGSIVIKSKNSSVVHNPDCRHLNMIKKDNISNLEIDANNLGSIVTCKTCGSDILKELI